MTIFGFYLKIKSLISSHCFWLLVRRKSFPILSFSLLKVLITIPTKRFKMKNEPTMMNARKNRNTDGLLLGMFT